MPKKPTSEFGPYAFNGTVVNFTAPIVLPSNNKSHFVFGFQSPLETRIANAVFYIPIDEPQAGGWVSKIFKALAQKTTIRVSWWQHAEWVPEEHDPSGYIVDVDDLK